MRPFLPKDNRQTQVRTGWQMMPGAGYQIWDNIYLRLGLDERRALVELVT